MQQPARFALGAFWHPALSEYDPLLAEAARATGMTCKNTPPGGRATKSPLPPVLCERCRLKRRDAKQPSGFSFSCPPEQQRSMRIQNRAFKCRQAIRKRHERHRSKWSGEDPRR